MDLDRRGFLAGSGLALFALSRPGRAWAACGGAGGLAALGAFLLQPCFKRIAVRRPPPVKRGPDGEIRKNIGNDVPLVLEEQASGLGWIRYGKLQGNEKAVAIGWKALDWGLARQRPDGGFDSQDPVHQITWFLEALACAMAVDPDAATALRKAGLSRGLAWLEEPRQRKTADRYGRTFTHRWWMRASLFQAASELLGQPALAGRAEDCVRQAIAQQAGGAFPERGGGDVGYQILAMLYLQRWLAMRPDGPLSGQAKTSMIAGLEWYLERVGADGIVDRTGSTRIPVENSYLGKPKDVLYNLAVEVMLGASLLTGDPRWTEASARLQRGAVAEGQAKPEALRPFDPQPDGTPSNEVLDLCKLCATG